MKSIIYRVVALFLCAFTLSAELENYPLWWTERGVVDEDPAGNTSPINQGQLLHMAEQAIAELEAQLASVGGANIEFNSFLDADDSSFYSPVNLGQLKHVSSQFYNRFAEIGFNESSVGWPKEMSLYQSSLNSLNRYPWASDITPENMNPSSIGQAKFLFLWDIASYAQQDADSDGIFDFWEVYFNIDPDKTIDNSETDFDGDSILDRDEYVQKTDPTDYYNGSEPTLTIVSGDAQDVITGMSSDSPVIVRVEDAGSTLRSNAPITVSVDPIAAGTVGDSQVSAASDILVRTNSSGESEITFNAAADYLGAVTLTFSAQSGANSVDVNAILTVVQSLLQWRIFTGPHQSFVVNDPLTHGAGSNQFGQVAGQIRSQVDAFSALSGITGEIKKIVAGPDHVVALTHAGDVFVWGDNFSGQLGLGTFMGATSPIPLPLSSVIDIAAGDGFSCFLVDDGLSPAVLHFAGDLGDGLSADAQLVAAPVEFDMSPFNTGEVVELVASGRRILARDTSGAVWAWGDNRLGQSDSSLSDLTVTAPVKVVSSGATRIYAAPDASLTLLSDGKLVGWGNSSFGQLGAISTQSMQPVALASNVAQAAVGNGFIAYVTDDNEVDDTNVLYTAGLNDQSQLGRDTGAEQLSVAASIELPTNDTITELTAGDRHLIYLTNSVVSPLYGFGDHRYGALGEDSTATSTIFTPTALTHNF